MDEALAVPIVMFVGLFLVWIVYILSKSVTRIFTHHADAALKTRMIDAGMSADDIERIVNAGRGGKGKKVAEVNPAKPPVKPQLARQDTPSYGPATP